MKTNNFIPAPFTNGADMQTDWFFDYLKIHHDGAYQNGTDDFMLFRYNDAYYMAHVKMFTNVAIIFQITGDYDYEGLYELIHDGLCEAFSDPESKVTYTDEYDNSGKSPKVIIKFYYKNND